MIKKITLLLFVVFLFFTAVHLFAVEETPSVVVGEDDVLVDRAKEYYSLGKIYKEHGLTDHASSEFQKAYDLMFKADAQPLSLSANRASEPQEEGSDREGQYIIGKADTLHVSVWENPDLTRTVNVRPDGHVSFPLIDEFKAVGLTIPDVDELVTNRLKEYLRYPDVSVTLESMGGRRVIVLGEVAKPGIVSLGDTGTVLEAIAIAGGETNDAVLKSVLVIKGGLRNPTPHRVNVARFLKTTDPADNMVLDSQDIVFVPETFLSDVTYTMKLILGPLAQGRIAHGDAKFYEDIKD